MIDKSKILDKEWVSIVNTKYGHMLQMPNGDIIKGIVFSRVTDPYDGVPTVIVKLQCNLVPHKEVDV